MAEGRSVDKERLSRALILVGGGVVFVTLVILEPRTTADMVVAAVGTAALLSGLYLSHREHSRTVETAEKEAEVLAAAPDVVPEEEELPRRG